MHPSAQRGASEWGESGEDLLCACAYVLGQTVYSHDCNTSSVSIVEREAFRCIVGLGVTKSHMSSSSSVHGLQCTRCGTPVSALHDYCEPEHPSSIPLITILGLCGLGTLFDQVVSVCRPPFFSVRHLPSCTPTASRRCIRRGMLMRGSMLDARQTSSQST